MGALDEVKDLAEAVVRRRSLRLWDVVVAGVPGRQIVRVFVDSDDGVDLDTVAEVSEEISRGLDLRDPIKGSYTLEVSTPGLERTLSSPEHFVLSVGRPVVVKTRRPFVAEGNRLEGDLVEASGELVKVRTGGGDEIEVPLEDIRSARTVFEWK